MKIFRTGFAAALLLAGSASVLADNRSFSGLFSGNESTLPSGPGSCFPDGSLDLPYVNAGTFQVSQAGEYVVLDASNIGFTGLGSLADLVVLVYAGSFNPANPQANLVAAVDFVTNEINVEPFVSLGAGTDYVLVVQRWCDGFEGVGAWGVLMEGPGAFSGAGFPTPAATYGDFGSAPRAVFPNTGGTQVAYAVGQTFTAPVSGTGVHASIDWSREDDGTPIDSAAVLMLYEGSFNPANTAANYVGEIGAVGPVPLEAGKSYTFVYLDGFGNAGTWRTAYYPPGQALMGKHLNGSWFNMATAGQGVLMDYGPNTAGGFLFLAWFTFANDGEGGGGAANTVGSDDQRWLTGFAPGVANQSEADITWNNTTGGVFNQPEPESVPNPEYGSGEISLVDCDRVIIDFDLSTGVSGTLDLQRGLPLDADDCYEQTPAGAMTP